jgi:hypothetical protein
LIRASEPDGVFAGFDFGFDFITQPRSGLVQ